MAYSTKISVYATFLENPNSNEVKQRNVFRSLYTFALRVHCNWPYNIIVGFFSFGLRNITRSLDLELFIDPEKMSYLQRRW